MTKAIISSMVSVGLLLGCASQQHSAAPKTCFRASQVDSWYAPSPNIIRVNAKDGLFEVKIVGACPDFEFHQAIGFYSSSGKICGNPWDELRFGPLNQRSSCMIDSVKRLSSDEFLGSSAKTGN